MSSPHLHLGHHHHHDHEGEDGLPGPAAAGGGRRGRALRYLAALAVVAAAVLAASTVLVDAGDAVVVTRFGDPVRVLTRPGIAWRLPAPLEDVTRVDLRLRTTSSGLHDVGTRDGLRVLVQAYAAWQVPDDPEHVRQFLRAVRNQPDEAAEQLRSFIGSALEITASSFDLADLIDSDPRRIRLADFERRLRQRLEQQMLQIYGITIRQVGIERLTLPPGTLDATVARMTAERETVAAQRTADGERAAAKISSDADRDARVVIANAKAEAAQLRADAQKQSAEIYGAAYRSDPALFTLLRSLDTLSNVISSNTRIVLRTDAAPFRAFVEGPGDLAPAKPPAAQPAGRSQ